VTGPTFFAEALARLIREFDEAVALAMELPAAGALVHEAPDHYGLR
jgi:hypothetical protein